MGIRIGIWFWLKCFQRNVFLLPFYSYMDFYDSIYTLLAGRYGAKNKYPEAEEQERIRNEKIVAFQEEKSKLETKPKKDTSLFSKILKLVSIVALIITLSIGRHCII